MINSQMDIRAKLFEQSFILNYKEIKKVGTTYYARLINEDVGGTFQPFTTNFIDSLFAIIRIFPILVTIFLWDYYLFAMFLTVLLFYFLYNYLQNKITVHLYQKLYQKYGIILNFINETLDKIFSLQIFNYYKKRKEQFNKIAGGLTEINKKLEVNKNNLRVLAIDLPIYIIRIAIIFYCIKKLITGNFTIGKVTAILTYYSFVENPLHSLKYLSETIISSSVLANRIFNFLNYCRSFYIPCIKVSKKNSNEIFKIKSLRKYQNLPQQVEIFSLDIKENIILGSECNEEFFKKIIEKLNMSRFENRKFWQNGAGLSGGEKNKIAFARFLYNIEKKDIFILDEPFLSLDSINKNLFLNYLLDSIKEKSGFIISHDFEILRLVANKFIVLQSDKIIEMGTEKELLAKNGLFKKLYDNFYKSKIKNTWCFPLK